MKWYAPSSNGEEMRSRQLQNHSHKGSHIPTSPPEGRGIISRSARKVNRLPKQEGCELHYDQKRTWVTTEFETWAAIDTPKLRVPLRVGILLAIIDRFLKRFKQMITNQ